MYIRRKVFSYQPSLEDIISEIEERAFSEGYMAAFEEEERLFASKRQMKKKASRVAEEAKRVEELSHIANVSPEKLAEARATLDKVTASAHALEDKFAPETNTLMKKARQEGAPTSVLKNADSIIDAKNEVKFAPQNAHSNYVAAENARAKKREYREGGVGKAVAESSAQARRDEMARQAQVRAERDRKKAENKAKRLAEKQEAEARQQQYLKEQKALKEAERAKATTQGTLTPVNQVAPKTENVVNTVVEEAKPSNIIKNEAENTVKKTEGFLSKLKRGATSKPALIGYGLAATGGLAYGGKKLYDRRKNNSAE